MSWADKALRKNRLEKRIAYLQDNQYRYKLQARAWGLDV